jgi:hypothetical protein
MTQRIDPITRAALQRIAADLVRNSGGVKAWRVGNQCVMAIEFRADAWPDAERAARDWFDEHRAHCESSEFTAYPVITHNREGLAAIHAAQRIRDLLATSEPDDQHDAAAVNTEGGTGARPWALHMNQGEQRGHQEAQG